MAIEEYYESQSKAGQGDIDYSLVIEQSITIDAILALNATFKSEYLNTLTTDALHDLEDSLINSLYET